MTTNLTNLAGNMCETLTILYFFKGMFAPRLKKKSFILCCIAITLIQFANTTLFLGTDSTIVFTTILVIISFTALFEMKWHYRLLYAILIYLTTALSEMLIGVVISFLLDTTITLTQQNVALFAVGTFVSKLLGFIFLLFFKKQNQNLRKKAIKHTSALIFCLPVSSVFITLMMLKMCYEISNSNTQIAMIVSSVLLIFANFAVFYFSEQEKHYILMHNELSRLQTEKNHYDIMEHQNRQLMIYAHDAKKHLLAIKALSSDPKIDDYIAKMTDNLRKYSDSCRSGNKTLDVIINRYKTQCELQEINFSFDVRQCNFSFVDDFDLVTIMGNIMDNAFESAQKSENGKIRLETETRNNYCIAIVTNSCETAPIIKNNKIQTTKKDKSIHGLGLKSAKNAVKKYDGDLFPEYNGDEKTFTTTVQLKNI